MGKKGTPHRKWSKEEKLYYIHLCRFVNDVLQIKESE